MDKKTKSVEKIQFKLSNINNKYRLPLKFKKSNNIFLSLPKLDTNNINKNRESKVKTIIIDKKLCNNFLNTMRNKKLYRTNSLTKAQFTGFFVIPKTSNTVRVAKINIPITFTEPTNFQKKTNFFSRNKNNKTNLFIQKPITDRSENLFFDPRKKYPVGKIISSKGEKNLTLNSQIYSFTLGSKFYPNIPGRKPMDKIMFKERIKKIIEGEKTKKKIKGKTPMNCRQVLEDIKNDRYFKTRSLIQKVVEESHRTKNDLAVFFDDFKKCKEFNDDN